MAIYQRCSQCRKDNKLGLKCCPKCSSRLGDKYLVKVKDNISGKWSTKLTPTLTLARQIELKLKTLNIEGNLLNKRKKDCFSFQKYLAHVKTYKKSWKDDKQRWNKHVAHRNYTSSQGIKAILASMEEKGYQPQTIHHVLKLIRRVYNWHIEADLYHSENPTKSLKRPKYDNQVNNFLSKEDLKILTTYLQTWDNRRAALAILFAIYTGRRKGEIVNLTWNNVNLDHRTYTCEQTKNGSTLSFPLNRKALQVILEAQSIRINHLVFPSRTGHQYSTGLSLAWVRLRKRLGLSIRFHDLRHTYASLLASSGQVDIYTLKTLLGHKDIKLTERYSHLSDSRLRQSTEVLDRIL